MVKSEWQAGFVPGIETKTTITRTVKIERDALERLVRMAVGAPSDARVLFDGGDTFLTEVEIEWRDAPPAPTGGRDDA